MVSADYILILSAYSMDLILGDPQWRFHPIRCIGHLIALFEKILGTKGSSTAVRLKGIAAVFLVISIVASITSVLLESAKKVNFLYGALIWIIIAYFTISVKDLSQHAAAVIKALEKDNLENARNQLSRMVGRDTQTLSRGQITSAVIESVAENTADGIVAPLIYLIAGGPILAMIYKTVNTMDSMIGHKNKRYRYFGWFAAKLDDVFNWIPARISGLLIVCATKLSGKYAHNAFRIMRRDGKNHSSPNSAISEAAMAGALKIQLGGPRSYAGIVYNHGFIGDPEEPVSVTKAYHAVSLSMLVSLLIACLGSFILWII